MKKKWLVTLLALGTLVSLTACGSKSEAVPYAPAERSAAIGYRDNAVEAPAQMEMKSAAQVAEGSGGDTRAALPDGVKMIYRASLELETTAYDPAREALAALTEQFGGYFESQTSNHYSADYRSSDYTIRIPAEQFDAFLSQVGNLCSVRRQSRNAEDVSERYYDTESRLETAKIKLDRLQELLARAESMEDVITIENAISDVEYQIESLSGELRHYDALIGYATVYVTLSEVYQTTEAENAPLRFGQRIGRAFRGGLRDFWSGLEDCAEWLAYHWLGILVFAAVALVIVKVVKRRRPFGCFCCRKKQDDTQQGKEP